MARALALGVVMTLGIVAVAPATTYFPVGQMFRWSPEQQDDQHLRRQGEVHRELLAELYANAPLG